jgi:hypothetical protein
MEPIAGGGIGVERATPLLAVLLVAPHPFMLVYVLFGSLIERKPARFLKPLVSPPSVAGHDGVDPCPYCAASLSRRFAGRREAYSGIRSQPHVAASAGEHVSEDPSLTTRR